jgi:ParB family chromosome partitioning protein
MALQLDDLAALEAPTLQNPGLPLMLPVAAIDEDPEQPRREFEDNRLEDLAETIRGRGVRQPISVRPNLHAPGRWMLNFGARRLRASKLVGMAEIPAFIDTTADNYDQVIENEQREGLRPLELALFVQKRIALGDNQAVIAKRLGKSRQWVTLATALIEPPDWLLQAYREGRCRGINELYDLRRRHGEHGAPVEAWAAEQPNITRDRLAEFRAALEPAPAAQPASFASAPSPARPSGPVWPAEAGRAVTPSPGPADPAQALRSAQRVHVEFEGHDYELVVSVVPNQAGGMYVRPVTGGPRRLAPVAALKLLGFVGARRLVNRIDNMRSAPAMQHVSHLRYTEPMKTATIPSVRVEPEFRAEVEAVLAEGESLTSFVETALRSSVERRRVQAEFVTRGLRARDDARRTGDYVDADDVVAGLQRKLDAARARVATKSK